MKKNCYAEVFAVRKVIAFVERTGFSILGVYQQLAPGGSPKSTA